MSDVKKLEEKLNNLESKLKATFEELEKRLNDLAATHTDTSENRFQEIEDLVLLIQVEQMKIMERMHASLDINLSDGSSTVNTNTKVAELEKIILQMAERIDLLEGKGEPTPLGVSALSLSKEAKVTNIHEISAVEEKKINNSHNSTHKNEAHEVASNTRDKLKKILAG